jgi:hypothetical protein
MYLAKETMSRKQEPSETLKGTLLALSCNLRFILSTLYDTFPLIKQAHFTVNAILTLDLELF